TDASASIRNLRDRLHHNLADALGDDLTLMGHPTERLPNTLNLSFKGQIGVYLLESVEGLCFSVGAACHSDADEPSGVLSAMGVPRDVALGAIRLSLGRPTHEAEIDSATTRLLNVLGGPHAHPSG
ncbi:MAG: cysteine desulfurase NifS, partial [bacterium]|nr:cysteine desulfurase NifS [bacterium]